jgi:hypothetical protein
MLECRRKKAEKYHLLSTDGMVEKFAARPLPG